MGGLMRSLRPRAHGFGPTILGTQSWALGPEHVALGLRTSN